MSASDLHSPLDHQSTSPATPSPLQLWASLQAAGLDASWITIGRDDLRAVGIDFSNAWLLRLEAEGRFPRRISIGDRNASWVASEVINFVKKRIEEREAVADGRRRLTQSGTSASRREVA